jgi:hypothetical protein
VGDQVLLANKGERGKKKLADKWEPTVYTVMDSKPQTHIYKLVDDKGNAKVVHRNLIMDISFLPVESADGGLSGSEDSLGDSENESHMEDLIDSLNEEGSMDRASAWVLSGAEDLPASGPVAKLMRMKISLMRGMIHLMRGRSSRLHQIQRQ